MNTILQVIIQYILPSLISLAGILIVTKVWLPQQRGKIRLELQSEYEKKLNEKKWEIYSEFINVSNEVFNAWLESFGKGDDIVIMWKAVEKIENLIPKLLLIGSEPVIRAFRNWRGTFYMTGFDYALKRYFEIIIEMRKDLGSEIIDLNFDDLMGSIMPNYQRILGEIENE